MIIVLTGVPGTGKSEVSQKLAKMLDAHIIDIKRMAAENRIITGYDISRDCFIIDEKKISAQIEKRIKKGENYIVDSLMGHYLLPKLVKLCVILRCRPAILKKRLEKRGYSHKKVSENVMAEYLDTILVESLENGHKSHLHEIDTSKRTSASVAQEIESVLKGKKKKKYGSMDWTK